MRKFSILTAVALAVGLLWQPSTASAIPVEGSCVLVDCDGFYKFDFVPAEDSDIFAGITDAVFTIEGDEIKTGNGATRR